MSEILIGLWRRRRCHSPALPEARKASTAAARLACFLVGARVSASRLHPLQVTEHPRVVSQGAIALILVPSIKLE